MFHKRIGDEADIKMDMNADVNPMLTIRYQDMQPGIIFFRLHAYLGPCLPLPLGCVAHWPLRTAPLNSARPGSGRFFSIITKQWQTEFKNTALRSHS